ncbi:hypothetical protein ACFQYP_36870 [Nonomuraea antimicrobica]
MPSAIGGEPTPTPLDPSSADDGGWGSAPLLVLVSFAKDWRWPLGCGSSPPYGAPPPYAPEARTVTWTGTTNTPGTEPR